MLTQEEETYILTELDAHESELTEKLYKMNSDEIFEYLNRVSKEDQVIYNSKNQGYIRMHEDRKHIIRLMYQLKCHRENTNHEGFSLT